MNKQRRKEIEMIITRLKFVKDDVKQVLSDEEDYHENIPENLQDSDRAMESEEAIEILEEVIESIDGTIEELENVI